MALYGADVESLRQLAQTFNNKSQVLDNDVNLALKALVSATDWQGSDGDKFKDDWDSVLAPQLRNAAQALAQAGWDLNRNADEQEQASGGGGGGVVGSSYGGGGITGSSGSFGGGSGSGGVTGSTGSFEDAGISGSSGSFADAGVTGSSGSFAVSGIAVGGNFGQQGVHVFGDGASPINYLPELPQLSTQYPADFVEIPERSVES
ncbi:MAG: WXG100 family type VII secretion target [Actinomyces graevenitzii]|uniref:WXG100 family type VII secretion target n=1 Tax=Actinomyces graevenitzii TaxID=55565 RepID=A0A9E7AG23_9ACTO|nr:WXG100 family type VII secretion target [Actinomyces graevenitzii]UQF79988.1 MAG: WXG100 family type VII secretion target [Actinomyces graevenitzii]